MSQDPSGHSLTLTTGGITLLSVLLGIGVTVGLGVTEAWWSAWPRGSSRPSCSASP
jgi:hypothetical protein